MRPLFLALMLFALAAPVFAQAGPREPSPGRVRGELRDQRGVTRSFEPGTFIVILALPPESPPFCEIVSAAWQDSFTDIAEGRDPHGKLGGLQNGVSAREGYKIEATADGRFELRDLPLNRRLALAARVQGLWRPFIEEIWLTREKPEVERVIDFFTLGADLSRLRVIEHALDLKTVIRDDLKYAAITVTETITIENPDQRLAALPPESVKGGPFIELELLKAPVLDAAFLPSLYGSALLYCQGVPAKEIRPVAPDERANLPWLFGGVDQMHGKPAQYTAGPQIALDAWHPLNLDGALDFVGEGETFFRLKQDGNGQNIAYLVFNRPVPPGENGKPGRLVIKLMHKAGVLLARPEGKVSLPRQLLMPVEELRALAAGGVTISALRVEGHFGLLGEPEIGSDGAMRYASVKTEGAPVKSGERYLFSLGFDRELQKQMAAIAKAAPPAHDPGANPAAPVVQKTLNVQSVYALLAVLFGLGFLITLLLTFRATREVQQIWVNEAHASKGEILIALAELERDFEARKLPAQSYLDQRKRLLNRAIDLESRRGARP